jgi:leader peptidase (prepilin peptidase)/N-methyltransferase
VTAVVAVVCGVVGLGVGLFVNVLIDRMPAREPVGRPACPACGAGRTLPWVRCRACGARFPLRYSVIEAATAGLFVAAAVRLGASWALPAFCVFFASLLAISVIDLGHFIIPNRVVYPTLFAIVPLLTVAAALQGAWSPLEHAAIGGVAGFLALFVVHMVSPRGMGFGDVRLAGVIGFMLGWLGLGYVVLAMFLSFLLASVIGITLMVARVKSRKDSVPFGPFMAMGAVVAVLWGQALIDAYTRGRG